MVVPLMILTASNKLGWISCALVAVLPWATKLFQNATFMMLADVNSGKQVALHFYTAIFGLSSPANWWAGSIVVFSVVAILVAINTTAQLNVLLKKVPDTDLLDRSF